MATAASSTSRLATIETPTKHCLSEQQREGGVVSTTTTCAGGGGGSTTGAGGGGATGGGAGGAGEATPGDIGCCSLDQHPACCAASQRVTASGSVAEGISGGGSSTGKPMRIGGVSGGRLTEARASSTIIFFVRFETPPLAGDTGRP